MMPSYIKALSVYLPKNTISNQDIAQRFPEWNAQQIFNKIGIEKRHVAAPDEFTSDMATRAIENLASTQNVDMQSVDFLILCTQTPDYLLPTTACLVQKKAGLPTRCAAIDINQGCSGYIYGLSIANGLIASGNFRNVLLVTADTYSKFIHPNDKGNISIFGDAATATLISHEGTYRIGSFTMGTDGSGEENLHVRNSAMRHRFNNNPNDMNNFLYMKGNKIVQFVMKYVPPVIFENLKANQLSISTTDKFIFHQANTFMLKKLREELGIPAEKFVLQMLEVGNTVSGSIPIALQREAIHFPSHLPMNIQLAGFGVGYSWGAVCIFKEH